MFKKSKRILCFIIVVAMTLSTLYFSALAEENNALTFNIIPAEASAKTSITVQNSVTGIKYDAQTDGKTFLLNDGTYTYIVRAPLYVTTMGTVEITGEDVALDIAMDQVPASELVLNGIGDDHQNGSNNNPSGRDMEVEGSGYIGWIRPVAWVKYKNVNLLGGVESYTLNYARQGNDNMGFDVRVAPSGSSIDDAVSIGALSFNTPSGGWGNPGLNLTCNSINAHSGGVQDVYVVFTSGEWNFGRVMFQLKPLPEGPQRFDTTLSVRPYDANVTVETLSGEICAPTETGGKTYNLEEGFYRYTVSKEGYETQSVVFPVNASKRIMAVLLPVGADDYARYEAESAEIQGANIIDNSGSSGGKKVGEFSVTTTLGAINSGFSNISHTKYAIQRETTGIVEVIIGYDSSVVGDNQDRIAVKSNDGAVKEVYLNGEGKSSVFVDMRAGQNTLYVSNVLTPKVSNDGNAWVDLDYVDINVATVPGSIEQSEGDSPYVPPNNPIIKSVFTADPEAHVWPDNPNKLYLYPSHDNYPSNGCDLMDGYHVYSTENMVDWVDEGEILRASDLDWQGGAERPFMWAPDAAYKDGYYYFYWPTPTDTSGGNWGSTWQTGVRRSRYPDRDFEEIPADETYTENFKGYIEGVGGDGMIDICVRVFDGEAYLYIGGSQRCYQAKLKDDMVTLDGSLEKLPDSVVPAYHEGPSVFERNGLYYLIYPGGADSSSGYSGDKFNYCIGETPLGPWEYKGAFFNPTGCDTSHGSVVEFRDKWYLFYHTQDLSSNGTLRSVCVDEVVFNEDGTIQRFTKTLDGVEQNGPDYIRPEGAIYGVDSAEVGNGAVKSRDSSAGHDGQVITDLYISGSTVEFKNVDGGDGSRAMIVFHYSTPDDLPKMTLSVNGYDYKNINFIKTGGRSFFAESTFTVKKLNPGTNNTIKLTSPSSGNGKITLNYIEVILLDEIDEPTVPVESIQINASALTLLRKGSTMQLEASVKPAGATDKTITWISSNSKVLSIDENGLAKGVGTGMVLITATARDGNKTSLIAIRVTT